MKHLFRLSYLLVLPLLYLSPEVRAENAPGAQQDVQDQQQQAAAEQTETQKQQPTAAQQEFLRKLHAVNQAEIKLGNLAKDKAQSQEAKQFGETLATDHEQLDKKLQDMAKTHNVDLTPDQAGQELQALKQKSEKTHQQLEQAEAGQFDRQFAQEMVKAHEEAIQMVEQAEGNLEGELKELASNSKTVLEKHRDMARQMETGKQRMGE